MTMRLPAVPEPTLRAELAPILAQAEQYFAQAKSGNTLRSYASGWRDFSAWCAAHHLSPCPATPPTLVLYLTQRAESVSVATLTSRLAAIRFFHQRRGEANSTTDPVVRDVLSGIRRVKGSRAAQVKGMTRDILAKLLNTTDYRLVDKRNRALLTVAYDLLGRRSELVALNVEDLYEADDGSATVLIRHSKTDASGTGVHLYLAPDTVGILRTWLDAAAITTGALFQSITKGGRPRARLSANYVARVFKQMAAAAGLPTEVVDQIAGHSARVGAAQDMAAHGIELASIMQAGRWKTPHMVARYTEKIAAQRGAAAQLACSQQRVKPMQV